MSKRKIERRRARIKYVRSHEENTSKKSKSRKGKKCVDLVFLANKKNRCVEENDGFIHLNWTAVGAERFRKYKQIKEEMRNQHEEE